MMRNLHRKRWRVESPITPLAEANLRTYHPVLRQILFNRGYSTPEAAQEYLQARQPTGTDPNNMLGILPAVERIEWAIAHEEPIAIYGDYDVDGVTATALLLDVLSRQGARVQGYIPNRFDEGYGLNCDALDNLHNQGVRLVITVDCGIRSIPEAEHAQKLGMDLIISDHHHPAAEVPPAFAIINPKQPSDPYPEKDLAGVGLAHKLASALVLRRGLPNNGSPAIDYLLDLVALGTVADLAPLVGENRYLVRNGLTYLQNPYRQGVMALIGVSGLQPAQVRASHISYILGPRLNAAGRLESALDALRLLRTTSVTEAARLAQQLDVQNRERQEITRQIQQSAEQSVLEEDPEAFLFFAAHPDYNPGVVGLAAARLSESYYRPAIVAHRGEQFTRGSCRSIPEFHITQALDECADLLEHHGGHAAAAGFTVRNENVPELVERLKSIAARQLADLDLRPVLKADMELPLRDLKPELLDYLDWLQPTGYGNRAAFFVSRDLKPLSVRAIGKDGVHLKFAVTDGWITFDAIAFQQGHWNGRMPPRVDIYYSFELNEYNGRTSLQLNVRDLKPSGEPD